MAVGEWDQRQLCPDGGCVGLIGPDGTCKVCGRAAPNWGDERKRGLLDPPDEDADADEDEDEDEDADADGADENADDEARDLAADEDDDDDEAPDDSAPAVASAPSNDWGSRALCPDGGCIGVIGPDGTCKVCGRAASESPEVALPAPAAVSTAAPISAAQPDAPAGDPGTPARARCLDVTCTGAIGPEGRCEVCGKAVA